MEAPEGTTELGIDIIKVDRIRDALARFGERFPKRILTDAERAYVRDRPENLAGRWAAKEAVVKAWSSTCFGHPEVIDPESVDLREIEVRTDAWGRPEVRLHGAIARSMDEYRVLVSLSHDPAADIAVAFVVLQHSSEASQG